MTDTLKLRFALKGFMSPFLERRVVGITDICALIDEVWACDVRGAKGGEEIDERPWITQGPPTLPVSHHSHYHKRAAWTHAKNCHVSQSQNAREPVARALC
jgi:hypothetical protein